MIVIGAPVHARGWILADWFDCLANQEGLDPSEIHIILNYGPDTDGTLDIIGREIARRRFHRVEVITDAPVGHSERRWWTMERYLMMVRLRNEILLRVREIGPDFYLSCDTDMLLPAHTLRTLFAEIGTYDAIAPLTFMTVQGEGCPNAFSAPGVRALVPSATTSQYAIFGVKLMGHAMYSRVDYAAHRHGEDLGWADNAARLGLTMALCPLVRVKHVMAPDLHGLLDPRVGF